jgi:hypothetical protein
MLLCGWFTSRSATSLSMKCIRAEHSASPRQREAVMRPDAIQPAPAAGRTTTRFLCSEPEHSPRPHLARPVLECSRAAVHLGCGAPGRHQWGASQSGTRRSPPCRRGRPGWPPPCRPIIRTISDRPERKDTMSSWRQGGKLYHHPISPSLNHWLLVFSRSHVNLNPLVPHESSPNQPSWAITGHLCPLSGPPGFPGHS